MRFFCGLLGVSICVSSVAAPQPRPVIRIPELEERIHRLINSQRRDRGLQPLSFDDALAAIARSHSRDMAKRGFFNHVNPDGRNPRQRAQRAGYSCRNALGENIYQNNLYSRVTTTGNRKSYDWKIMEDIAAGTVKGWMASPGHRANILEASYLKTGIGAAIGAGGEVYITQMFCR